MIQIFNIWFKFKGFEILFIKGFPAAKNGLKSIEFIKGYIILPLMRNLQTKLLYLKPGSVLKHESKLLVNKYF